MPTDQLLRSACEEALGAAPADVFTAVCADPLDGEDCRILRGALSRLGRSDAETQRSQLDEAIGRLSARRDAARAALVQRERLSLTIGTMAGLSAAILLL